MTFSSRQKKWFKWLAILFSIPVFLFLLYYYIAEWRFKDILKYVVEKESNGAYAFDAKSIKLSLLDKTVFIQDAKLISTDSLHASPYYDVKIPQIYLSIQSLKQLIFHGTLLVDSLSIALPSLRKHDNGEHKTSTQVHFQFSKVAQLLEKTMERLQVRSFSLQNGSFDYRNRKSRFPFISNRINLSLKNFRKRNDSTDTRLFGSDDVDLDIRNQYWNLPDGLHEISFKKLHFSGRNQFFELDSFHFRSRDTTGGGVMISAERMFFNSKQLWASYEKEELIIDTVLLYRPVIDFQSSHKKKEKDSTKNIEKTVHELFKELRFKYVDVVEGEIVLNDRSSDTTTFARQRTNLRIYNLAIDRENTQITTDSIHLKLNNTRFVTKDSMFQMNIGEFTLHNKSVLLTNIEYGPTALNKNLKGMTFKAPFLRLNDISVGDLLNKRFKGSSAELIRPEISLFDKRKSKTEERVAKKPKGNIDQFFKTLHGLSELISVDNFNIAGGNMKFRSSSGAVPMAIDMKNIYLTLLLNKFFVSDSLIDIKRSMPLLKIQEVKVNAGDFTLQLHDYMFEGLARHNRARDFTLSPGNGTILKGKDLYWEILDWDMLQKHKIIQVEYIRMGMLDVSTTGAKKTVKKDPKDLPTINIMRVDLNQIRFRNNNPGKNSSLHFDAREMCISGIGSYKNFLTWEEATGIISNISIQNPKMNTSVEKVTFSNQYETIFHSTSVDIKNDKNSTQLRIPITKLKMNIRSTDFSTFNANELVVNNPVIKISSVTDNVSYVVQKAAPTGMPIDLTLDNFTVNNASVEYISEKPVDTIAINTIVNINAKNLHTHKKQVKLIEYDKLEIDIKDAHLTKNKIELSAPNNSILLTKGQLQKNGNQPIAFTSGLLFKWNEVKFENKKSDTTGLLVEKLSGSFNDPTFSFNPKVKLKWKELMKQAYINEGAVTYRGKDIIAKASSLQWNEKPKTLSLYAFSILPKLSREETFKSAEWQKDYMTIAGDAVHISGIHFNQQAGDSTLEIKKVVAQHIELSTTRDKRIPFKHGVYKTMPTILIGAIKMPIRIDSVLVEHSNVTVNEISDKTNKQGTIPLQDINAVLTNVSNDPANKDSLIIVANAKLLNYYVRHLRYSEAYGDSLSNFRMTVNVSPLTLPALSGITIPLAAISIDHGSSDTMYATWVGNNHAAIGKMDFYYQDLKVRLLDKNDPNKKSFKLNVINSLAGLVVHKKNDDSSVIFFERDKEKFVFNYWVKTVLGGLSTSAGLKRDKKALKRYKKVQKKYSLPENPFQ